jgi:hypothetical protein
MCEHCDGTNGQHTFGDIVGLEPVVPVVSDPPEESDLIECCSCGDKFDENDIRTDDGGSEYCEDCYSDNYSSCEECSAEVACDDLRSEEIHSNCNRRTTHSGCYCESCFDDKYARCDGCSNYFAKDNLRNVDDNDYCDSCYCDNYTGCERCGCDVANDDVCYVDDCSYCESCAPCDTGDFDAKRFRPFDNTFARIGSRRTFGVELETNVCSGYMRLAGQVYFGAKDDGSINGKEFVSTVLSGDEGLKAIDDFCAKADANNWNVDTACGYHVHLGVEELDITALKAVAYAYKLTAEVWASFVSKSRRGNTYCGPTDWTREDLAALESVEQFRDFASNLDRYQWLNLASYCRHSTFEIRLHSGTLDSDKICNWVIAHARLIDWASTRTMAQIHAELSGLSVQGLFNKLSAIWADAELTAFYVNRASKFGRALGNPATFVAA